MSRFDRASARLYADLALKIIVNKSTDSALRKTARLTSLNAVLPQGHGRESIYFRICRNTLGDYIANGNDLQRQALIDLAYEVARDLLENCASLLVDHPIMGVLKRATPAQVADLTKASRYSQRVDLFDRDEPETSPPTRMTLKQANAADDAAEIARAGTPHEVAA